MKSSRRIRKSVLFGLFLLLFAIAATLAADEFSCEICFFNNCGRTNADDYGWANCFYRNICTSYMIAPGVYITFCRELCTVTEPCAFPPPGG